MHLMPEICAVVNKELGSLFVVDLMHDECCRIRTPFRYPDGDVIDIFCSIHNESHNGLLHPDGSLSRSDLIRVSDAGETIRWLKDNNLSFDNRTVAGVCELYNTTFIKGEIADIRKLEDISQAILNILHAVLHVSAYLS